MPGASDARKTFLLTEAALTMRQELESMVEDPAYNTSARTTTQDEYVNKHLAYVSHYPYINLQQYVNNLKMKSRI